MGQQRGVKIKALTEKRCIEHRRVPEPMQQIHTHGFMEDLQVPSAIRTEMITNENLEILFQFCCGKATKFPQVIFRICFRNGHVGHAQATTAGHTHEITINSQRLSFAFAFVIQQRENPKPWIIFIYFARNCFCGDGSCYRSHQNQTSTSIFMPK